MNVSSEALDQLAISPEEYALAVDRLGREPNLVELGIIGSLWSEHCSYKHSKPLLRMFPSDSERVLVEPGAENAGAVDIGDGLAVVMKIESHNHPSAIEPYEGAATGVGGIVRDIFTMGARPIALMNSLRFGPLDSARNRYLFNGVVSGISGYGNCLGIPNVGGEVVFSPTYSGNPLVNAMCVGIVRTDGLLKARAEGTGNLLILVGADTGRDGIHGASGLASRTFEEERELRPTVQVGNPFLEKVLIEACLELSEAGLLVGLADLGAAGLTSSVVESAGRAGSGVDIDVARVPRREEGMTPYEVMLSESQERMLLIVTPDRKAEVDEITEKWDLHSDVIGKVTDDGRVKVRDEGILVSDLPVGVLTNPPLYTIEATKPEGLTELQEFDFDSLPMPDSGPDEVLLRLLASPNVASKESVYRQYDHQVMTNTVVPPGGDAALLRIKGTRKAIALSTDGNGRYCYLDPYAGGAIAVAEAARNVACVGARAIAVTDCLNFGNPEKPEVYYQLEQCIKGMTEACNTFGIPVISGNVSLYNETMNEPIYPTPVAGVLGLLEDVTLACRMGFQEPGDEVLLLGTPPSADGLGGSEYLEVLHGTVAGKPSISLDTEKRVQELCISLIEKGLLRSAHDCSMGGLGVALALCAVRGQIGFSGEIGVEGRWDAVLFGERQSRIVVSVAPGDVEGVRKMAEESGVMVTGLGVVGGDRLTIGNYIDLPLKEIERVWKNGLSDAMR